MTVIIKDIIIIVILVMLFVGEAVTCDDIGATGALAALLIDTVKPSLL